MSTATRETLEQEYNRLMDERGEIASAMRAANATTPEDRDRLQAIGKRVKEILAIPPQGYTLPKAAADLLAHAEAHGWITYAQWTQPGWDGEPYVQVQLAHKLTEDEAAEHRSNYFHFKLTWHSRGCAPGKLRRSGPGLAKTPDKPQWHDAPSVTAIRAVIEQHPKPEPTPAHLH